MKAKHSALVATLIACGSIPSIAGAQSMPDFKFSGFGTLSAVHSNDKSSDFIGTIFQPNGAGKTSSTSLNPDTKLGGQINANFSEKLSGVLQVVAQHQYDNSYKPHIEWANLKYQLTEELSVRAGRIAAPSYLLSESRFVGYSYAWARPPVEAYSVLPITSNDGIDATWRTQISGTNNTLQAFVGRSSTKLSSESDVKSKPSWGINDSIEIGSLTLRAGYSAYKLDLGIADLQPLLDAATQLGLTGITNKYKLKGMSLSAVSLGAVYDPGDWFATGELVDFKGAGFLSDSRAWYASAGYRIGTLTPYITYSSIKAGIDAETGAGPLNATLTSTVYALNATQKTSSLGLRWDAIKNVAIKAQYDRVRTGNQSSGFLLTHPGFVSGKGVNLVTLAADFVF